VALEKVEETAPFGHGSVELDSAIKYLPSRDQRKRFQQGVIM
jgi:hypothetical protein